MKLTKSDKMEILDGITEDSVFHFIEDGVVQDVVPFKEYVAEVLRGKMDTEDRGLLDWIKMVANKRYIGINISGKEVMGFNNMQREYKVGEKIEYEKFQ